MNIKVKRLALIKSLEKALKKRLDAQTASEKADKEYKAEIAAFEAKVVETIMSGKCKVQTVSCNNWRYTNELRASVEVILPKSMKMPERTGFYAPSTHQIIEIQNAIALLNLSDEEFVNASTYKSVSQYIS